MADKLLEYLGLGVAGVAIVLVLENNIPAVNRAVSRIIPGVVSRIAPISPSKIIPVSTEAPQPTIASRRIPGQFHTGPQKANDPARVRVDGTNNVEFVGNPEIYSLSNNFYQGSNSNRYFYESDLGYKESDGLERYFGPEGFI